ncbi:MULTISPECIES: hypothetical protein [Microcystis]|nr:MULTISPECIES: hypothetical protein [Microcystis]CCI32703.1 hypothetical protein MICAI_2710026 [Microcystis sp. T1-4]
MFILYLIPPTYLTAVTFSLSMLRIPTIPEFWQFIKRQIPQRK